MRKPGHQLLVGCSAIVTFEVLPFSLIRIEQLKSKAFVASFRKSHCSLCVKLLELTRRRLYPFFLGAAEAAWYSGESFARVAPSIQYFATAAFAVSVGRFARAAVESTTDKPMASIRQINAWHIRCNLFMLTSSNPFQGRE
jgi:hypothetical protein